MTEKTPASSDTNSCPQSENPSAAPADSARCTQADVAASPAPASSSNEIPGPASSAQALSTDASPAASLLNYAAPAQSDLRLHLSKVNRYRNLLQWVFPVYVLSWVVLGCAFSMGRDLDPVAEQLVGILVFCSLCVLASSILVLPALTILLALTMKNMPDAILGGLGGLIPLGNLIMAIRQTRRAERYLDAKGFWRLGYDQPEKGTHS